MPEMIILPRKTKTANREKGGFLLTASLQSLLFALVAHQPSPEGTW